MSEGSFCDTPILPSRADARREKLIEVARALFAQNGFHSTGIAELARQSGIAVGQIYRDFASKEDIVAEIVKRDCALFLSAETLRIAIAANDIAGVRGWIDDIVETDESEDNNALFAEIIAESSRNARIAEIFETVHTDVRENMLAALAVVLPESVSAERRATLADTILTLSLGVLHHRLIGKGAPALTVIAALKNIVRREIDDVEAAS